MFQSVPREDTFQHKKLRHLLVKEVKEKGIKDERVLTALNAVPRHFFLESGFDRHAYENKAFSILAGQTISHPFTVAFQTELLELKKFDKVLEVGTGSSYQICVLGELSLLSGLNLQLFTIERQKALYEFVNNFFYIKKFKTMKRFYGDGFAGLPTYAPFDKIIVTCGAPEVPTRLIEQLKPGGMLVAPVGATDTQEMIRITKDESGALSTENFGTFSFVPMLEGTDKHSK
jgi:protein-L-isoaspartate(D-aspartate) O-methyltransferase